MQSPTFRPSQRNTLWRTRRIICTPARRFESRCSDTLIQRQREIVRSMKSETRSHRTCSQSGGWPTLSPRKQIRGCPILARSLRKGGRGRPRHVCSVSTYAGPKVTRATELNIEAARRNNRGTRWPARIPTQPWKTTQLPTRIAFSAHSANPLRLCDESS
jgi:hypothetical protein